MLTWNGLSASEKEEVIDLLRSSADESIEYYQESIDEGDAKQADGYRHYVAMMHATIVHLNGWDDKIHDFLVNGER